MLVSWVVSMNLDHVLSLGFDRTLRDLSSEIEERFGMRRQLTPFHLLQELLDDRVQHGPAPDQGTIPRADEAHGDYLNTVICKRCNAILTENVGLAIHAHH